MILISCAIMNSLVVLSLLLSFVFGDQGFKEDPANLNNSSAVRYMESILQEFNQDTRWGTLDTAEMVISSMMPVTDNLDNLRFDISKLDGAFKSAELRIFRHADPGCDSPVVKVRQNRCEKCEKIESKTEQGDGNKAGWLVFNVTKVVQFWMEDLGKNQGFTISAGCNNIELGTSGKFSPLMVCYSKRNSGPTDIRSLVKIEKRSIIDPSQQKIREMLHDHQIVQKNLANVRDRTEFCGIKSFDLRFTDIEMDYIIAPNRINFTYCDGVCKSTDVDNLSYFKEYEHFQLFRELQRFYPEKVPAKFCLPTKFSGLQILYFNVSYEVSIKEMLNVNAEMCPCE